MKTYSRITSVALAQIYLILLISSCVPVFSDLQNARTLGSGQLEMTPYYTNTGNDSESNGASHIGANIGVGLSDKIDLRAKIDHNWLNGEEDTGTTIIGIGPKFALVPNRIAFFLPVGTGVGGGMGTTWQTQPTLFFTQPIVKDKFELTIAPKYIQGLCEGCGGNFATNFGIAAGKDFSKVSWRAEYGRIFTSDGGIGQFSMGLSFVLNPKK
ncbi:hypothetical protein E4S40_02805 [Algoriphagus kandeliae]|uniref:Outer membrane protein beta-barrel domain-containing protein n=1 Tax=Algoriphagus kandeliae TaxID=2562278 RepID=A0A4Y9QZL0_9BACT|nr:hypothetical protein [Algoriphagus kandeliae]TFV97597.1 hypothetical protein E4S40_02805 [Algoriphagus kandeliae]